ncbi:MAG: MBL fold metallo-hydrolase [Clostridia bacterium]|nr:MBL fold metallo-hydrolase [Clostridia bacterium]
MIRIRYGDTTIPESWIFAGGDPEKAIPIFFSCFLVLTDTKKILVDAGCETMPGFVMSDFRKPMEVLEEMGYRTEDITDVLLTHGHHDHAQGVFRFPGAAIHIQKEAYREGSRFIPEGSPVHLYGDTCILDDDVTAVTIGGHMAGSSVVEVIWSGQKYVLCGDEAYSTYNIREKIPTATSVSPEKSREFIDRYAGGDWICLLCHQE